MSMNSSSKQSSFVHGREETLRGMILNLEGTADDDGHENDTKKGTARNKPL